MGRMLFSGFAADIKLFAIAAAVFVFIMTASLLICRRLSKGKKAFYLILTLLFVTGLFSFGFLMKSGEPAASETDSVSVISSGSDYEAVSLEIIEARLSGIRPYIKIRWKNSGDKECVFGAQYDILKQNTMGSFESTLNNDIWISIAYILQSRAENEKIYYIDSDTIPEKGIYRFESYFNTEENGERSEKYTTYVDFMTESGVSEMTEKQFSMKELIYDNGSFSAVIDAENLPDIKLSPEMVLFIKDGENWQETGIFQEISLTKDNFDQRIWHSGVTDQISAVDVRSDNKRAWQLQVKSSSDEEKSRLYVLLEQNDGTLLFGSGFYNETGIPQPNSDSSYLQWICLIEEKA